MLRSAQKYLQSQLHMNMGNSYRLRKYPKCLFNNLRWYLRTSHCLGARPRMTWLWTEVPSHQVCHPRLDPICWNIIDLVPAKAGISDSEHKISRWFGIHVAQRINKLPVSAQKYLQSWLHTNMGNSYRLRKYPECLFNNLRWYLRTSRCLEARPRMTWLWTEVLSYQVRRPRLDPICWNIIDLVPARAGISDLEHEISR